MGNSPVLIAQSPGISPADSRNDFIDRLRAWAKADPKETDRLRVPLPKALPITLAVKSHGEIPVSDWVALFNAVKTRLRNIAGALPDMTVQDAATPNLQDIKACVMDCAQALDYLYSSFADERVLRQQLEMEIFDMKAMLTQVSTELADTQFGEQQALYQAQHDSLTSLPNRSHFHQQLNHSLSLAELEGRALALFYLDLDDFKQINDMYGHDAGDELLRIVSARLTRAVRTDDLVGRLGGDEFAFLLGDTPGHDHLAALAIKLLDAVSAPVKIAETRLNVRCSIGVALFPVDGKTADDLLKSADSAMYQAKRERTGHAFFNRPAGIKAA